MNELPWWNNVTNKSDNAQPTTDEIARQYIPQNDDAQNMYNFYRENGLPILKSLINVLHASIGEKAPFPLDDKE